MLFRLIFSFLPALLIFTNYSYSQVEITTQSGDAFVGILYKQDDKTITLKTFDLIEIKILEKEIEVTKKLKTRLITNSGHEYSGHIKKLENNKYTVITDSGSEIEIPVSSVKEYSTNSTVGKSKIDEYGMIGGALGTPGVLNLILGYQFNNSFGNKLSFGGFYGEDPVFGLQINAMFNIIKRPSVEQNISLGFGWSQIEHSWLYTGIFYDINIYGVYSELGLTIGDGIYSNPQLFFQLGYVYRYND